jgi:hypothetical protein
MFGMPAAAFSSALFWRPAPPPLALAAIMLLLAAMLTIQGRRLSQRFGFSRAWPVVAARAVTVLLLLIAILDPAYSRRTAGGIRRRLLVLVDRSESMSVRDDGTTTREARADALLHKLGDRLSDSVDLTVWSFAGTVWKDEPPPDRQGRGTDLAGALLAAADQAGDADAIVLLSDGGDEPPEPPRFPRAPVYACAMGTDAATWRDTAIESLQGPATVERNTSFALKTHLRAHGHLVPGFHETLASREVCLWHRSPDGTESLLGKRLANLDSGRAEVTFSATGAEVGLHHYRIELAATQGELSPLNNRRTLRVEVRGESLGVLFFSRRLGADLKRLRQALSADPSLAFTALYRTSGEHYTVQAPDGADTAEIQHGLPSAPGALRPYACLIVGAFPAELWRADEMRAVLAYVSEGGGLIWLGGEEAFEGGGYGASALAPLIPWRMRSGASTLLREEAPISIPPSAATDPAVAGLNEVLKEVRPGNDGGLVLTAFHVVQDLSPAARVLLEVNRPHGRAPVLLAQSYGRGRVYAFASNTSWQWAGGPPAAASFYRRLWQQLVRAAANQADGGRHLQVTWEGNRLRPAGRTSARVQVVGAGEIDLHATLTDAHGRQTLPIAPADEATDRRRVELTFRNRGGHHFRLEAFRDGTPIEVYEKKLHVTPPDEEGSHLERQMGILARLATRTGGRAYPEEESAQLIDALERALRGRKQTERVSLVSQHPWFALACLAALSAGWLLRRGLNLI